MQERVRLGRAPAAPQFDKHRTLEKTVRTAGEAGRLGLDLLVLPETSFDCLGHSARFEALSLKVRGRAWTPFGPAPGPQGAGPQASEGPGTGPASAGALPGEHPSR